MFDHFDPPRAKKTVTIFPVYADKLDLVSLVCFICQDGIHSCLGIFDFHKFGWLEIFTFQIGISDHIKC